MSEVARFEVVVPALAMLAPDGTIDFAATARYASLAGSTWIDRFILSGSTTGGAHLGVSERAAILDLWLERVDRRRLLACSWTPADVVEARARSVAPIAVLQGLRSTAEAVAFLSALPDRAAIYSHPMFGGTVFDAELARAATAAGSVPMGGKLAKISLDEIATVRGIIGPGFRLWDGSSRRVAAALAAGASGVVATPLAALPQPFPDRAIPALQAAIDAIQTTLDDLPGRPERAVALRDLARRAVPA